MPGWVNSIQKISDGAGGYTDWEGDVITPGGRNTGTTNAYNAAVEEWEYTVWTHSDGDLIVSSNPVNLRAIIETSALTGDVTLRDGTSAAGTSIGTYAASQEFYGIKLDGGLFIDDNATAGTILVIWRDQ